MNRLGPLFVWLLSLGTVHLRVIHVLVSPVLLLSDNSIARRYQSLSNNKLKEICIFSTFDDYELSFCPHLCIYFLWAHKFT